MQKSTKKVDVIIIAVILLLIAGGILLAVISSGKDGSAEANEYNTLEELSDKNIGVMMGSVYESIIEKNMPDAQISFFDKASDMAAAVSTSKIDGFACSEVQARRLIEENGGLKILSGSPGRTDIAFAFPKTDKGKALRDEFNEFLSDIGADGILDELRSKWLSAGGSRTMDMPELSGENGTLRMATTGTTEPFTYILNGKIVGIDIELAALFCEKYGYRLETDVMDFGALIPALASSTYDLAGANITVTDERAESVYFSDSYTYNNVAVVVKGSEAAVIEDRPFSYYAENKKIGAITGGLYEIMIRERYPDAEILQYNNQPDMAVALSAGVIDAFTCSESTAKDFMKEDPTLTYLNEVFMEIPYGFAFEKSPDKEYLRDRMNEFLEKLHSDGTYDKLVSTWFGDDESVKAVDLSGLTGGNGSIRYITAPTMQPFSYIANGDNAGFEVDIVARFCREYGYSLTIDNAEFASLIPGITSGMYDIASGTIMITEERAESVNFSDVYYTANAVAVVKNETVTDETNGTGIFESIASSFEKNFIREDRWKLIVEGVGTTCLITVLSAIFGSALAFLVCMFRRTGSRLANAISNIYVKLLQGTPMVVLLMILYYVIFGKSGLEAVWVAVIGFTLNFGAYASEIMRSGIESIDGGQREAALALGYNENQAFFRFIFPQATMRFIPVYMQEIVSLLKSTSIVGYIAIQDLTKMSDIIRSRTYEAFFPLIVTAIIYFIIAWVISLVLKIILNAIDKRHRKGGAAKSV